MSRRKLASWAIACLLLQMASPFSMASTWAREAVAKYFAANQRTVSDGQGPFGLLALTVGPLPARTL